MKLSSKTPYCLVIGTVLCCLAFGCNKPPALPKTPTSTFASAAPELKQHWDEAVTCSQKNDYVGATTNLMVLQAQHAALSQKQNNAVEELWAAMGNKTFAAAEKGDPEAVKAMLIIRKSTRPR